MDILMLVIFGFSLLAFLFFIIRDKRTVLLGLSFITMITSLIIWASLSIHDNKILVFIFSILVGAIILCTPIIIIISLISNGIKIIINEGFSFKNSLSLGLGILFIIDIALIPYALNNFNSNKFWFFIYLYLNLLAAYFLIVSSSYAIGGWFNFFNLPFKKINYIVVLGCGIRDYEITPLLESRVKKGIKIYKKHPGSKLIMSGGQGADEIVPEAYAMAQYAIKKGIDEQDIILEDQSTNTYENITNSYKLMKNGYKFAIVTNYYHLFRALIIAKELNIKCFGYGATTKIYYSINAFIRELIGYLYLKSKTHFINIIILTILFLIGMTYYLIKF